MGREEQCVEVKETVDFVGNGVRTQALVVTAGTATRGVLSGDLIASCTCKYPRPMQQDGYSWWCKRCRGFLFVHHPGDIWYGGLRP